MSPTRFAPLAVAATAALALAACSQQVARAPAPPPPPPSPSGMVGVTDMSLRLAPTSRLVLASDEAFSMPEADFANALPVYPQHLLADRLAPQALCLRVSVGVDGTVTGTAPLAAPPDCPEAGGIPAVFVTAAEQAARTWHFDPALRCRVESRDAAGRPSCAPRSETAQAVSLSSRFVFEQRDGRGTVRVDE